MNTCILKNDNLILLFFSQSNKVSSTHQRLTVELTDMAESEQQQTEQQNMDVEGSGHDMQSRAISTFHDSQSYLMRDWVLVAAGLERLFFMVYAMAFGVITAVYIWNSTYK